MPPIHKHKVLWEYQNRVMFLEERCMLRCPDLHCFKFIPYSHIPLWKFIHINVATWMHCILFSIIKSIDKVKGISSGLKNKTEKSYGVYPFSPICHIIKCDNIRRISVVLGCS